MANKKHVVEATNGKKICTCCNRLLPVSAFTHWTRQDGSIGYSSQCMSCNNRIKREKKKQYEAMNLCAYITDKELLLEVKRRGLHIPKYETILDF